MNLKRNDHGNKTQFQNCFKTRARGGYTVIVPSLQGCITHGDTIEDALQMAEDAIRAYIASMKKHGEAVIDDSKTLESMLSLEYA
jgi:predicted RNase H-like HicB family nuclease